MIVRSISWHRIAVALATLALAVRVLVPAGFMPAAGVGGPTLVICGGQGPMAMPAGHAMAHAAMAHPGSHDPAPQDHGADHACPFGALAAAVDRAAEGDALPLPAVAATALAALFAFIRPGIGLAAPPPPKTGPPAFR